MRVVWDPKKASVNLAKHKVEFSHAATVLDDPLAVTIKDKDHEEQRFVTLGADAMGRALVVVYAWSGEEDIRLISARKATPVERRTYEEKRR